MTTGYYTILFNGKEYDNWSSFHTTRSLDLNNEEGTITFPDFQPMSNVPFVNSDVKILRDGVPWWRGLGMSYENVLNANNLRDWNLTMQSNKIYLSREIFRKASSTSYVYGESLYGLANCALTNTSSAPFPPVNAGGTFSTWQNTTGLGILNDILSCQYNTVLALGQTTTAYPHTSIMIARQKCSAVLQSMINSILYELRFNPTNTVDFLQTVGSSTPVMSLYEGVNLVDFRFKYGIDNFINDPVVCGAGTASGNYGTFTDNQIFQEPNNNTASLAAYGRFSDVFSFPNVTDKNTLLAYANALQVDLQTPVYTLDLLVTVQLSGAPFSLGDTVSVTSSTLGLNTALYRIIKIDTQYDANNGETISLTVQPSSRMVSLTHQRLKKLEFILNSQMSINQATANTLNPTASNNAALTMGQTNNSGCYLTGIENSMALTYANSFSGNFNGATIKIIVFWSSSPGTVTASIYDETAAAYLMSSFNPTNGTVYSVSIPSTQDIIDHIIQWSVTWGTGGQAVSFTPYINFTAPAIPT